MKGPFRTKQEAEAALETEEKTPPPFCPLINSACNSNCICFKKPTMDETTDSRGRSCGWYVCPAYCSNAMFSEERTVTNQY